MEKTRSKSTSYYESHTASSSGKAFTSSYSYSSSSNFNKQNSPNVLQYSSKGNTQTTSYVGEMKPIFPAGVSLINPGSTKTYDATPFKSPAKTISLPNAPRTVQPSNPPPLIQPSRSIPVRSPYATSPPPKPTPRPVPPLLDSEPTKTANPSTSFFSRAFSFRKNTSKRGYALILNHETFKLDGKNPRTGTHHDVNKLKVVFNFFNIETHIKNDLTFNQIQRKVKKLQKADFSKYECFIIVMLTHGDGRHLYANDAKYEFIEVIEDPLLSKNRTLLDKPKIVITHSTRDENATSHEIDTIPTRAVTTIKRNIYKCNAPHFHPKSQQGTLFMQTFCNHLKNKGKYHDINDIMMSVIDDVTKAADKPPEEPIPTTESTMTKTFYFGELLNQKK